MLKNEYELEEENITWTKPVLTAIICFTFIFTTKEECKKFNTDKL